MIKTVFIPTVSAKPYIMKKNLLITAIASSLLTGGAAWALSSSAPARTSTIGSVSEWVMSPENGSSTTELPNTAATPHQTITFTNSTLDGDNFDAIDKSKVSVTYNGKEVAQVVWPTDAEPGEDSYGYNIYATNDYDGARVEVNYQVFTDPGVLKIDLAEGAITDFDGNVSPAMSYTRSYGAEEEKCISIKEMRPADKSTVKTLSAVTLFFDLSTLGDEFIVCGDDPSAVTLTENGTGKSTHALSVEYDEAAGYVENTMPYSIKFPEISAAGQYTLTIPQGFFWSATDTGDKPASATENGEITAVFTVDPDMKAPIDNYVVLSPAVAPQEIRSLSEVLIHFPEFQWIMMGEDTATLTKDGVDTGCTGNLSYDYSLGSMNVAKISFTDSNDEDIVLNDKGIYELTIPAGAISGGSESNSEIRLSFMVNPDAEIVYSWTADPADGSDIAMPGDSESCLTFTFTIQNADMIDISKEWQDPNSDLTGSSKVIQVEYDGNSVPRVENAVADKGYQIVSGWEDNDFMFRVNSKVFSRPGSFKILIDKGCFTVNGTDPSPMISYSCIVGDPSQGVDYEAVIYPENNPEETYDLYSFKEFKVEFPNARNAEMRMREDYDDNDNLIMVEDVNPSLKIGDVEYHGDYTITPVEDAGCPTFIFTFPEMKEFDNQLGGRLLFSLDKGAFILDSKYDSPAASQSWKIKRVKPIDKNYVLSPQGDIVNQGYGLFPAMVFSEEETLGFTGECTLKLNGEVIEDPDWKIQNFAVSFELTAEKFMDPTLTGQLSIEIPEGAITVSGEPVEAVSHTWNIVLPKTFTYKTTPEFTVKSADAVPPVVNDLSEIILEVPDAVSVAVWNKYYINLHSYDYFTYSSKAPSTFEITTHNGNQAVKMTFDPAPTEDTIYELALDYGALYIDNAYDTPSMNFIADFKGRSGVSLIAADEDGLYTVYTLDGKIVVRKGTFDDVRTLEKGIYIVNGNKLSIR